ncbi:DedA family protein [Gryllotalpicola reticulitermitis]|uniref:DedA family protein n=1 Tax=Gryllotalpicola reticulitermitis TaxID=1184153 RepID=A0ABV8Q3G8_9MICO
MLASIPLLDPSGLLHSFGPWVLIGIAVIVFIESGVLFPFLPGDSLLITAAILAPVLGIQPWSIVLVAAIAAFAGDQAGYLIGKRLGRRLFKPDARVLKTAHLDRAEAFFLRYGAVSLVLGRFVPVVRTYVPLAAGIVAMPYRRFTPWNVLGGCIWASIMVILGILLGGIPFVTKNIDVLMVVVVLISVLPLAVSALRARRKASAGE